MALSTAPLSGSTPPALFWEKAKLKRAFPWQPKPPGKIGRYTSVAKGNETFSGELRLYQVSGSVRSAFRIPGESFARRSHARKEKGTGTPTGRAVVRSADRVYAGARCSCRR